MGNLLLISGIKLNEIEKLESPLFYSVSLSPLIVYQNLDLNQQPFSVKFIKAKIITFYLPTLLLKLTH